MKIRLHWSEQYEVVRTYPAFIMDTEQFPELELEIANVYTAQEGGGVSQIKEALFDLEHKMYQPQPAGSLNSPSRGECIMDMVQPWECSGRQEQETKIGGELKFSGNGED
jgi:hypothetical protein